MNNYAISSDGIATALQDSASALMEGGNNLEQATALVAAANKVVQDPNSVGSALRTISLRLRGTSVEILEEMGEETDGVVESTSKLQEKIKALSGIDILTDAGEYKDTYTILKEIGQVWEDMSDIDQAALLELMAGKNRANTLSAILSNMKDLEGAYESAMNAEGSALKENETYLDSIQGSIDLFNNAVQTMWMNFTNSDVIKFIVNVGTGLIKIVDNIGLIGTALIGVIGYLTLIKKQDLSKTLFGGAIISKKNKMSLLEGADLDEELKRYKAAFNQGAEAFGQYRAEAKQAGNGMDILAEKIENGTIQTSHAEVATKDYTTALNSQSNAARNAAHAEQKKNMIVGATAIIVAGVISAIQYWADSIKTVDERYEELRENMSELESDITSLDSELEAINEKIDDLSNKNLTITEAEELRKLKAQSAELQRQKELKEGIMSVYDKQNELTTLDAFNKKLSETAANQQKTKDGWKTAAKVVGTIADALLIIGGVAVTGASFGGAGALGAAMIGAGSTGAASSLAGVAADKWGGSGKSVDNMTDWYNSYTDAITKAEQEAVEAESKYWNNMSDGNYDKWQKKLEKVNTLKEDLYNNLSEFQTYFDGLEYNDATKDTIDDFNRMVAQISITSMDGDVDAQISSIQSFEEEFNKLSRGVDENGNNIALTADEYARYNAIVTQVLSFQTGLTQGYDENGNAILKVADQQYSYNQLLEQSIALMQQQRKEAVKTAVNDENIFAAYEAAKNIYENTAIQDKNLVPNIETKQYYDKNNDYITASWSMYDSERIIGDIIGVKENWWESVTSDESNIIKNNVDSVKNKKGQILEAIRESVLSEGFTEEEANKYVAEYSVWLDDLIEKTQTATSKSRDKFKESLSIVPQGSDYYEDLSGSQLSFINEYINTYVDGLENFSKLKEHDITEIRDTIASLTDEIAQNEDAQKIIDDMFALDPNSMPVDTYKNNIIEAYRELIKAAPEVENELKRAGILDEDVWFAMMVPTDETIDKMQTEVGKKLKTNQQDLVKYLSLEELKIAFRLIPELPDNITWEGLRAEIEKQMPEISGPIVDTYSTFKEKLTGFDDALAQTSEVVLDNTKVTQEYKDALVELGISEEELSECFDSENKLVVKNAKALNNLVKQAKSSYAQNVKLAKSQARLQYYEKYKELVKLTNGQKVNNAVTLNKIKTLYAEMTLLQKTISQYGILEHQLLGATNAFEDFAKAQDIDAANDYESKAEELVGYLVDAFHTGKLGAESAQAAIKGLVPESVYADLDTLDEKMAAVYKYFTEDLSDYFYVKFNDDGSLESAEMLVDNIKKFVEDGIGNGVFTGSWEEWDLDPTINSLDELSKKMNVTKEVAFAFLQAMETYDISWIGGDASTLLDRLLPSTAEIEAFGKEMQQSYENAGLDKDVDLTQRVNVSREVMIENGWEMGDDSYATVHTISAFASEFGLADENGNDYAINITPILPDGTVIKGGEDVFKDWIRDQLASGKTIDDLNIVLGTYITMDEAEQEANRLHELQSDYYDMLKSYNLENELYGTTLKIASLEVKIAEGSATVEEIEEYSNAILTLNDLNYKAKDKALNFSETQESLNSAQERLVLLGDALKEAKEKGEDWTGTIIDGVSYTADNIEYLESDVRQATNKVQDLSEELALIGDVTDYELQVAMDRAKQDIDDFKKEHENDLIMMDAVTQIEVRGIESFGFEKDANGVYTIESIMDVFPNLDENQAEYVRNFINLVDADHTLNARLGQDVPTVEQTLGEILTTLQEIANILNPEYGVNLDTSDAETKADSLYSKIQGIVNILSAINSFATGDVLSGVRTIFGGGVQVDGTARVGGTAFAGGSWGAENTETVLTGELGPELLVRDGRWTTIGENGAEFTKIKKGDIIFNHKQTESLLKNGHIASRGKAHASGTAFASGTAYDIGTVNTWLDGMNIDSDWKNIGAPIWDAATNGEYLADALKDASDSVNEFEETIDWIEIRMEELDEVLSLYSANLENAATSVDKNNIIDQMIAVNEDIYSNAIAGAKYYQEYADKYLAGMNSQLVAAAKDGSIAITEFTKEQDEATVNAIQKYREFAQKASDLTQKAVETITEIRSLAIQKIDNAQTTGDVKATVEDSQTEKLQNAIDLIEESGNIADDDYYLAMMENSNKKVEYLTAARKEMQKEFDDAVKSGALIKGSDEWYENLDKLYQIDSEIAGATKELEEFQNAINDIYWDNFDQLISRLDYVNDDAQGLIDLMDSADMVTHSEDREYMPGGEKYWTSEDVTWTDEGLATMGLYAQQMEVAEAKAKQYAKAIDDLKADFEAGKYSENEYLEKLNELTSSQYDAIESYHDAQDAIKDLNKTRIDMIKDGIEKEIDAYAELADKRKESLDAEKEAYNWEKSISKQQKSLSDIDRQLAAIAGDNSMAAAAKRKRLEAERAELQSELDDMYYERSVDNQKKAIDTEVETFTKNKEEEIKKWDEYLENVELLIADSLGIVQTNASGIYDTLSSKASEYDLTLHDALLTPWQDGSSAVSDYQTTFDTASSSTMEQLELINQKWQEIIETTNGAAKASVDAINAENNAYIAAEKQEVKNEVPKQQSTSKSSSGSKSVTVGSTINASGATIYATASGGGANTQYYGSDPIYVVIGENGGYWMVRHRSLSSGVTGWFKKSDVSAYAKGTTGTKKDELAWIDELGPELQLVPDGNGRLEYIKHGTAIIPHDISENLIRLGQLDPSIMLDQNRPTINAPHVVNNETVISLEYGDILHIDNFSGDKPEDLSKMIDKAFNKHMKQLNSEIRRFTR